MTETTQSGAFHDRRDDLFRAVPGVEVRSDGTGTMPTLTGHFAVFNEWTEINSAYEGNFLERIQPGAFKKTFTDQRAGMRVLFQHGRDPQIGDKPLAAIETLSEDERGAYYEARMLDTAYNREIIPGLVAGLYGASFRFRAQRQDVVEDPGASEFNPRGLPERSIREAQVMEFGPVTFPAYPGATAGVRSITDLIEDVDAIARATPILLDDERLNRARAFIARSPAETPPSPEDSDPALDAVADDERSAEPAEAHPAPESTTAHPSDAATAKSHLVRGSREPQSNLIPRRDKQSWLV